MLPSRAILLLSVSLGLAACVLIGVLYIWPRMRKATKRDALTALVIPHCFRYLGLAFLIHGVTTNALDPRFSYPTAYGDLLTTVLAFAVIAALRANSIFANPLIWVFSVIGIVDFMYAFPQGLALSTPGDLGAVYFIAVIVVPPLMVSHGLIIVRLFSKEPSSQVPAGN